MSRIGVSLFILITFMGLPSFANAFEQTYPQLNLRGTSNGWSVTSMSLVADHTWQVNAQFAATDTERFKFDVYGDWSTNFGDDQADGYADASGGDIAVTQGEGIYQITLNDETLQYSVTKQGGENLLPVADAGEDISLNVGDTAFFNAGSSYDSDGQIVSYTWSNGLSGVAPSLTYEQAGLYTVVLTVTDNDGASATDSVLINVTAADAEHNFEALSLRGTHNDWSTTAMVAVANHSWEATVTFSGDADDRFKFDRFGDWSENYGDSNADGIAEIAGGDILINQGAGDYFITFNDATLTYSVSKAGESNLPPVADAGDDITLLVGETAYFSAAGSRDSDGDIVAYAWSNGLQGVNPTLTYPNAGSYQVTLTVTDDDGATATDTVVVTVKDDSVQQNFTHLYLRGTHNGWATGEMALVEDNTWQATATFAAGSEQRFKFDQLGDWSLNYGDNEADGWAEQAGEDIFITQGPGEYLITFNDSNFSYRVEKTGIDNQAPIAEAGADITISVGEVAYFDGSLSQDPDGEIVSYQWSNGLSGVAPSLVYGTAGDYVVTLTVTDDGGLIATDNVTVLVSAPDAAPDACRSDINFLGDTDKDGLPDCAELDGIPYFEEYYYQLGARVGTPDLFVEIDWMETTDLGVIPQREALEKVKASFAAEGIAIHFDTGSLYHADAGISPDDFDLGGGNALPFTKTIQLQYSSNPEIAGLYNLKIEHMSYARRFNAPWYYLVFGSSRNLTGSAGSSGVAWVNGKEAIVSLGQWGLNRKTTRNTNLLINYQAGTVMHEFGHNLGLLHGGNDNVNYKPNYLSTMNYMHQLDGLPTIGLDEGDRLMRRLHGSVCVPYLSNAPTDDYRHFRISYSHGLSIDMDETGDAPLHDAVGFGHPNSGAIDYNCNGYPNDIEYGLDVNKDGAYTVVRDHDDWGSINFYFYKGDGGVAGARAFVEPVAIEEEAPDAEFFNQLKAMMD
ncbi:PKD domain-containing protein [Corallincola spongiicola]|uniref:PKD domain-containing protein n=1 Tax=Corallincola spongiicola TaxID=2520508 RepID=A0ABY1WTB4_9GAMM|nr:PKD domain-containing protein [Corallincola spongiicola]TAA47975.1 PKD domain-containing protein [Corallincola spongiicola]